MTFEEAISLFERIKDQVVGAPVKGRFIESLFIGPTNWDARFYEYLLTERRR